jgi:hypothetical protein
MDANNLIRAMAQNANRIYSLASGVAPAQAVWKPDPGSWSILEVVNHLYEEERLDFRVRLDLILHHPEQEDWPPIDPPRWVVERRYNQRRLEPFLANFMKERQASLAWLRSLGRVDWQAGVPAPWGGVYHAGDMLAAWAAHDVLHMRQLVELQHAWIVQLAGPYDSGYAGDW